MYKEEGEVGQCIKRGGPIYHEPFEYAKTRQVASLSPGTSKSRISILQAVRKTFSKSSTFPDSGSDQ